TLGSPRSVAVDASGNVYIADTLGGTNAPPAATGGSIRLLAGGMGTVTVTVQPFAAIAPGRGAVFSAGVPAGVRDKTGQAIVLALSNVTDSAAAARKSSYVLSTTFGRRVHRIAIKRVTYDAATKTVRIFPAVKLGACRKPMVYELIIRGQSPAPVTL